MENPEYWRTVQDGQTGAALPLSEEQLELIRRLQRGNFGDVAFDPYEPAVDFFSHEVRIHPVTNRPADKRSFIPSLVEKEKVGDPESPEFRQGDPGGKAEEGGKIPMGWIQPRKPKENVPTFYDLWAREDPNSVLGRHKMHVPAPKIPLPGHAESYNPPPEFLLSPEEVSTARCLRSIPVGSVVRSVAWNPNPSICLVAVALDEQVLLVNPGLGDRLLVAATDQLLDSWEAPEEERVQPVRWIPAGPEERGKGIRLLVQHDKVGSDRHSRDPGDNVICGSYDSKLAWFDLDLSTRPYRLLRHHGRAVRAVAFHRRFPLFASGSDDGSVIVCHGMVYRKEGQGIEQDLEYELGKDLE
ncbi:Ribosome biogenesis protein bOP1 [Lonchura striata]|uniref:Ribosome biogenesis protein bOP1 n=1 Tax=Lonchura striata TaxID=40157 RepID=A0A218U7U2_9PASE|nr:Ribosome biogenesis protein bOP1 [Lonchura striata domestica]